MFAGIVIVNIPAQFVPYCGTGLHCHARISPDNGEKEEI